jgi:hypothetical protein
VLPIPVKEEVEGCSTAPIEYGFRFDFVLAHAPHAQKAATP